MVNLAEIGIGIVDDDILAGNHQRKLALICQQFGLNQSDAEAAFTVFREAAEASKRIRQAVIVVGRDA